MRSRTSATCRRESGQHDEAAPPCPVALSVVGTDRTDNGYFRAKLAQEKLIEASGVPYTIIRATQFMEFLGGIADSSADGNTIRLPPILFQPIAADDVAAIVAEVALPSDRHPVSANASETKPAKLLAVFVVDTNETELTIPFGN